LPGRVALKRQSAIAQANVAAGLAGDRPWVNAGQALNLCRQRASLFEILDWPTRLCRPLDNLTRLSLRDGITQIRVKWLLRLVNRLFRWVRWRL